jgi:hypothetical protein
MEKDTKGIEIPIPQKYHNLNKKVRRLCKFVSYNPLETDTPKQVSNYSVWKKHFRRIKNEGARDK